MIAFLGMGLLGSNFVKALRRKGETVQVWNRTASKAKALEADGAVAFEQVADAVRGADRVHIVVKDDAAVDEVLANALPGLQPGAIIVDHTTTSREGAIARTAAWQAKGFTYLHAPVFMGPANALEGSGFMLVSGDQSLIAKMEPLLAPMTGKLLNLGDETGRAAGLKLIGNLFLVTFTAGLADTFALAKALEVPVDAVADLFKVWNPANTLPTRIQRMTGGDYSKPSWELNMARKDTGLFMQEAAQAGVPLNIIPAIAKVMDQWIAKGHGDQDWTIIGSAALQ
ncbi:3-hydroxyisobutyrate dehydrogenase [Chitinophaga jiangningensis]|uniref:3-hydroxyisobutyrate dehydrogenase n=1 Tax=Chitinophaga jiangningensis TaxID=1419482 RepID=A0A1M7BVK6_9BACT|nr:NAD(P)-dependent oxidoreductase [Chitinophaga jiangningensis]SHL58967.1 3-hydroxyisobutyrate dehydrogenase [Chitinophaga jiangningensis]